MTNYITAVDAKGYVGIETPDSDGIERWYLHQGVRVDELPDPANPHRRIMRLVGGWEDQPGFETDRVVFSLSGPHLAAIAVAFSNAAHNTLPVAVDHDRRNYLRGAFLLAGVLLALAIMLVPAS